MIQKISDNGDPTVVRVPADTGYLTSSSVNLLLCGSGNWTACIKHSFSSAASLSLDSFILVLAVLLAD